MFSLSYLSKKEKIIFLILSFVALFGYSWLQICQWWLGGADNAFIVQLAKNIAKSGQPTSQVAHAVQEILRETIVLPAEKICAAALDQSSQLKEFNYFKWHTYFILYIFAPIHWLIGPKVFLPIFNTACFLTIPIGGYLFLRKNLVNPLLSVLAIFFILSHPAWSTGMLGQIYIDRFLLCFGFLLVLSLY